MPSCSPQAPPQQKRIRAQNLTPAEKSLSTAQVDAGLVASSKGIPGDTPERLELLPAAISQQSGSALIVLLLLCSSHADPGNVCTCSNILYMQEYGTRRDIDDSGLGFLLVHF